MSNPFKTLALAGVATLALSASALAEIKLGATISETGPASFLGDPEAKTLKLLVEKINAAGGIKGEKIKLFLYDDGGDPNKARTFATRLVEEDGVVAIIGGTTTGTTMAVMPVAGENKIPFISLAGAIEIIDPVQPFVFKTPHTDKMACEKIFEDIKKRGLSKVGMLSGTDGFGASMRKQCLAVAPAWGMTIVADETYGPKDTDMTPQLTTIRGKEGVQAIVTPGFGQGPAIVTRNYNQLSMTIPLYQSHGVASNSFIQLAGAKESEGVRIPGTALLVADLLAADDPQKKVVTEYKALFEGATKTPVSTFGGYAHDAFAIFVDAAKRSKSFKAVDLRDAIEGTSKLVGTTGTVTMSAKDHIGLDLSSFRMLEIRNGGWTLVK
ncbi:MAG: ABC transporter substrate-binding protein [Proteobacteria bacterium]|nr:ABC transporter substrate-binding protein [Pseudomonadota bacterium]